MESTGRPSQPTRVLVVEDDETIGEALLRSLGAQGHQVSWERSGAGALAAASAAEYDLVLLDLGLPDLDGVEVCRRLRQTLPAAVVVMLTARGEGIDVVVGLDAGADDCIVKPIGLAELHARIRAHLRRRASDDPATAVVHIGALTINSTSRRVTVGDRDLGLRRKEFDLLLRLATERDVAITRETLITDVWDEHWFGSTKTLDVHIAVLRKRLTEYPDLPRIVTVRGYGYWLEPPPARAGPLTRSAAARAGWPAAW